MEHYGGAIHWLWVETETRDAGEVIRELRKYLRTYHPFVQTPRVLRDVALRARKSVRRTSEAIGWFAMKSALEEEDAGDVSAARRRIGRDRSR